VGWLLAEQLTGVDGLTAVSTHQLLPEHAEQIAAAAFVLFVDATVQGAPGEVTLRPLQPQTSASTASHQMDPAALLAIAQHLYGRCPPAHLLTITGYSFGYEEQLSPQLTTQLPQLTHQIINVIRDA
jgi:hydrogenase maturation protease